MARRKAVVKRRTTSSTKRNATKRTSRATARKRDTTPEQKSVARELRLSRPLVFLDVETTGLSPTKNRIIEYAFIKLHPDGRRESLNQRLNPGQESEPEALAVHGIHPADVATCPTFAKLAPDLLTFLSRADLSGFNIERFDVPFLTHEFARAGLTFPAAEGPVHLLDTMRIFQHHEPRDLPAAFRFYCGRELHDHHSAGADSLASEQILLAQVRRYDALPADVPAMHDYMHVRPPAWIDPDGKIIWRAERAVLNFGKHQFRALEDLVEAEPGYLRWVVSADFSKAVVAIVTAALQGTFPVLPIPVV